MNQKSKNLKLIFTIIGLLIYIISWTNQLFTLNLLNISTEAFSVISIFFASIILWIFVATDWPSLLAILAIGLIPKIGFNQALQSSFGNQTFVFLLFTFVVTYALNQTSFLKRVSFNLLNTKLAKSSGYGFIVSLLLVVLIISSIMSPTVIFMFFFPLYEELVQQFGWKKGDKSANRLIFALFTTIAIGTAMTPINHVFSVTAMSIFKESTGIEISNSQYILLGIPSGLIIFGFLLLFIRKMDFTNIKNVNLKSLEIQEKMEKREKIIISIFFTMVALWIVPEMFISILPSFAKFIKGNGLAFPPLLATIFLLILKIENKPLLNISDAISKGAHWPSLLLVSSTLLLGSTISNQEIGVVEIIQKNIIPIIVNASPMLIVLIFTLAAGIFTNFTSNLVTVSFISTVLMTIKPGGVELAALISMIGFASSLAMMTAPSMPYVAISIGSGWINSKDCIKYGGIFLIISTIVLVFVTYNIGLIVF